MCRGGVPTAERRPPTRRSTGARWWSWCGQAARPGSWLGTSLEDRPHYTPTTTIETFPFPGGLSPDIPAADYAGDPRAAAIAEAAGRLAGLRERWLNPREWVDKPAPGYPKRPVTRDEAAAKALKDRTLTNLYNTRDCQDLRV